MTQNSIQAKSYQSQVSSNPKLQQQNVYASVNNLVSNKENIYQKTPIEHVQTEASGSERRNSFFANRNSGDLPSIKDSYEGNRKMIDEEHKYNCINFTIFLEENSTVQYSGQPS